MFTTKCRQLSNKFVRIKSIFKPENAFIVQKKHLAKLLDVSVITRKCLFMFGIHNLSLKYGKKTLLHPTSLKFQEGKLYTTYRKSSLLNKIGLNSIKVSKGDIAVKYYIYTVLLNQEGTKIKVSELINLRKLSHVFVLFLLSFCNKVT